MIKATKKIKQGGRQWQGSLPELNPRGVQLPAAKTSGADGNSVRKERRRGGMRPDWSGAQRRLRLQRACLQDSVTRRDTGTRSGTPRWGSGQEQGVRTQVYGEEK